MNLAIFCKARAFVNFISCFSLAAAIMFYAIGRELLSQESPNAIFGKTFKRCKNDEEVRNCETFYLKFLTSISFISISVVFHDFYSDG